MLHGLVGRSTIGIYRAVADSTHLHQGPSTGDRRGCRKPQLDAVVLPLKKHFARTLHDEEALLDLKSAAQNGRRLKSCFLSFRLLGILKMHLTSTCSEQSQDFGG